MVKESSHRYRKSDFKILRGTGMRKGYKVAGVPVVRIPESASGYSSFMSWWKEVGRLHPEDPQGWGTLSGPGVVRGRTELITADVWGALPESERELIQSWALNLPLEMFFD